MVSNSALCIMHSAFITCRAEEGEQFCILHSAFCIYYVAWDRVVCKFGKKWGRVGKFRLRFVFSLRDNVDFFAFFGYYCNKMRFTLLFFIGIIYKFYPNPCIFAKYML